MTVDRGVEHGILVHYPRAVITPHVSRKLLKPLSALDFRLGALYLLIVYDGEGKWHISDCGLTHEKMDEDEVEELKSRGISVGEHNEFYVLTGDYDFINDMKKMVDGLGKYY